jgi:ComF family protein
MLGMLRRLAGTRCLVCAAVTDGPGLCPACAKGLTPRVSGFCPGCGDMEGEEGRAVSLCAACRLERRPWDALGFFGEYSGALREAVLSLKFGGRLGTMGLLGELARRAYMLGREREDGFCADEPDVVVAVPMHWRRLLTRGYNQSVELARALASGKGWPVAAKALAKVRHTRPQSRLSARERKANLDGAFTADERAVSGRRVLLVDDVMTTGSTLGAASRALKNACASRVEVLVLARDRKRG